MAAIETYPGRWLKRIANWFKTPELPPKMDIDFPDFPFFVEWRECGHPRTGEDVYIAWVPVPESPLGMVASDFSSMRELVSFTRNWQEWKEKEAEKLRAEGQG